MATAAWRHKTEDLRDVKGNSASVVDFVDPMTLLDASVSSYASVDAASGRTSDALYQSDMVEC